MLDEPQTAVEKPIEPNRLTTPFPAKKLVSLGSSGTQTSILLDEPRTAVEKPIEPNRPTSPFPSCLTSKKKSTNVDKILDVFNKVQVNVPLLDIIQQVLSYAKFLKNLCT